MEGRRMVGVAVLGSVLLGGAFSALAGQNSAEVSSTAGEKERSGNDAPLVRILELRILDLEERLNAQASELANRVADLENEVRFMRVQSGRVTLPYATREGGGRPVAGRSGNVVWRGTLGGRVSFSTAFLSAPKVSFALSELDVYSGTNTRLRAVVTSVDREGFDYEFTSWSSTHVYAATAVWIAVAQ